MAAVRLTALTDTEIPDIQIRAMATDRTAATDMIRLLISLAMDIPDKDRPRMISAAMSN